MMAFPLFSFAEAPKADSTETLQACFQQFREEGLTTFSIDCTAELLQTIKENDYAALGQLCLLSGIEDYKLQDTDSGMLVFDHVVYGNPNVALCETLEDAKTAISRFMDENVDEITLVCSAEAFQSLFNEGRMYRLMSELGVEDFTMKGNSLHHIFLSNLQRTTVPFAIVSSVSEASEKISGWREEGKTEFHLLFDETVFADLTRDYYRLIAFLGGAERYSLSYNTTTAMLLFSQVVYTDTPSAYCTSEEELVSTIRAMGARGITSFQLMLDQETYDTVYADSFARLYELEAQAGMTDARLGFSSASRLLAFENATITADVTVLSTLAEATAHVEACAARGDSDIAMLLSADVYNQLMEGVQNRTRTDNDESRDELDKIFQAINERKQISYSYFDYDLRKQRKYRYKDDIKCISPWAVIYDNNFY